MKAVFLVKLSSAFTSLHLNIIFVCAFTWREIRGQIAGGLFPKFWGMVCQIKLLRCDVDLLRILKIRRKETRRVFFWSTVFHYTVITVFFFIIAQVRVLHNLDTQSQLRRSLTVGSKFHFLVLGCQFKRETCSSAQCRLSFHSRRPCNNQSAGLQCANSSHRHRWSCRALR